eukprot:TRINITY_DN14336_c0_g1_i1.p1 TRINITY_DN14336_c0_g1~~TRINITY_DN14336_c0_g1_i1.p1  ORF type:complete len:250 (+),score=41.79 TRINITY_DN14336_c0_g1_i1:20-769(+)
MARVHRRLMSIGYPFADTFNSKVVQDNQELVSWLEDSVICFWQPEARTGLRTFDAHWNEHFTNYLSDMECPRSFDGSNHFLVVDWLLTRAVLFAYEDQAATGNVNVEAAMFAQQATFNNTMQSLNNSTQYDSTQFSQAVFSLATTLGLPPHNDVVQVLKAIEHLLSAKFSPGTLAEVQQQHSSVNGKLDIFPLGFSSGDAVVDRAVTVLRLLYTSDQRELQTCINDLIVAVQNFTASPKTDAALGKVGR